MLTPRPYQIVGRDFLAARRFALLADEMRVGKTPQAILAAAEIGAESIQVVCPAIAVPQWELELSRWWPENQRLHSRSVVSYDRFRIDSGAILRCHYDVAIVDECHFAKNPEAQRAKLIYGKDGLGWCSDRMWVLSGTPAPKHAGELWPMLRAFGAVGMTYYEFTRRYCTFDWTNTKITGTRIDRIPELRALLATIMLRRTRKEVAPDMPAIGFEFLNIDPTAKVDYSDCSDEELSALLEYPQSFDRENRHEVASAKVLPLADEIAEAIDGGLLKKTVVFGWHKEPLKALVRALNERGILADLITGDSTPRDRERVQDNFRGRLQVVAANILAAGTAIDLSAASHGYFLELDWVPGNNVQAANRLISMDKTEPVTMDVVTWPGSVDNRIQKVLLRRTQELARLY
jgi:SNF2 family DNA or RNA helicase